MRARSTRQTSWRRTCRGCGAPPVRASDRPRRRRRGGGAPGAMAAGPGGGGRGAGGRGAAAGAPPAVGAGAETGATTETTESPAGAQTPASAAAAPAGGDAGGDGGGGGFGPPQTPIPPKTFDLANAYSIDGWFGDSYVDLIPDRLETAILVGDPRESLGAAHIATGRGPQTSG